MSHRQGGDATGHLWVEAGESRTGPVATVVLDAPVDTAYAYSISGELETRVQPGQRVKVPIGRAGSIRVGFCIAIDRRPWDASLRPLAGVVDEPAMLTPELLRLGEWIAGYYGCPLGVTLSALVPAPARRGAGSRMERWVEITDLGRAEGPQGGESVFAGLLAAIMNAGAPMAEDKLVTQHNIPKSQIARAAKNHLLTVMRRRVAAPAPTFDLPRQEPDFALNAAQTDAYRALERRLASGGFSVTVLHGVAGSGKTELYVRAMRAAVAGGGQAIMLVPEIMLTTQLVNRLACRFTGLAVLHSGLSDRDRSLLWHEIAAGWRPIVVGTRSAVFAPCPDLKLIVVDEEHETTYKNQRSPRYHARDVALKRAQLIGIPVILGSATPSLETWHNCRRLPHFHLADLPHRVGRAVMPTVHIADMEAETRERGNRSVLSRALELELSAALARQEQAILLVNRRGYSTWMFCPQCGLWLTCPNCSANLVLHQPERKLWCHYCRYSMSIPERCPERNCGGRLVQRGCGTQRLEERVKQRWPMARFRRVDSDTMKHRLDYQQTIDAFERHELDILIGTQMVAKGLDFPLVSLVGVIGAEAVGAAGDFRAGERLFQLLIQVAGRAGRADRPGTVIVQSMTPREPTLEAAARQDFAAYADAELRVRQHCLYPPHFRLIRWVVSDRSQLRAKDIAESLFSTLRGFALDTALPDEVVTGPMPCVIERVAGKYRYELLVRVGSSREVEQLMSRWRFGEVASMVRKAAVVDVDPVSLA